MRYILENKEKVNFYISEERNLHLLWYLNPESNEVEIQLASFIPELKTKQYYLMTNKDSNKEIMSKDRDLIKFLQSTFEEKLRENYTSHPNIDFTKQSTDRIGNLQQRNEIFTEEMGVDTFTKYYTKPYFSRNGDII